MADVQMERLFAGSAASGPHWLSIFLAVVDGKVDSTEVMLDNKPWPDGVALVHAQRWPEDVRWETKRQFLIALPVD